MGRPPKRKGEKTVDVSVTLPEALRDRLYALRASTPFSASEIVAAALEQRIEAFEADPREILTDEK